MSRPSGETSEAGDGFHQVGAETAAESPSVAAGYSLVLPPGWRKIPLRGGTAKVIRAIVKDAVARAAPHGPQDTVSAYRVELERRFAEMVADARAGGGIDMYLPVMPVHDTAIPASFIVSETTIEQTAPSLAALAAELSESGGLVREVSVDGAAGLRIGRTNGPVPAKGLDVGSRCVDYMLPVPGSMVARWLVIAFSTLGGGDPEDRISVLLTDLFDAMMSTFRWGWKEAL
jgi:hypothetical protein